MIAKKQYKTGFAGYHILDCAVRSKQAFTFYLCETLGAKTKREPEKRLMTFFTDDGEVGGRQLTGFDGAHVAVANTPLVQAILVSRSGGVAVHGSGTAGMENAIPMGPELAARTDIAALTTIDGYIYAVGGWRAVCRRTAANQWESMAHDGNGMPKPKGKNGMTDSHFEAIDAYGPNDIYCVGGVGEVWHFNGLKWRQCPTLTNWNLESVCCAGDGFVYIGAPGGSIIKGRHDSWKFIHKGQMTLSFKDMVWFADKLWCTSDYGVWVVENDTLVEAKLPAEISVCAGNLAVGDGVMLLAGVYGAAVFDGKKWEVLISKLDNE